MHVFFRHYRQEQFDKKGPYDGYDIAILQLSSPITFSSRILPVCLPSVPIELDQEKVQLLLAGFGISYDHYKEYIQVSNTPF